MARVLDTISRDRLFQLGIRSFSPGLGDVRAEPVPVEVLAPVERVRAAIGTRPVYVTLDIDVLDPGVMPDVQTPQPGGCSYRDLALSLAGTRGSQGRRLRLSRGLPEDHASRQPGLPPAAELVRELCLLLTKRRIVKSV